MRIAGTGEQKVLQLFIGSILRVIVEVCQLGMAQQAYEATLPPLRFSLAIGHRLVLCSA